LYKVIKSAVANGMTAWMKMEDLSIKAIEVWRWPKIKRIKFASRSRVNYRIKHRAFVKVVLNTKWT
jgi:ribosomal protein L22